MKQAIAEAYCCSPDSVEIINITEGSTNVNFLIKDFFDAMNTIFKKCSK